MANYLDGMSGGKHSSDDTLTSFYPKKKKKAVPKPTVPEIRKAKRVKFTVVTRDGKQTATRDIIGFSENGECVYVRFNGWNPFFLNFFEVIEIIK